MPTDAEVLAADLTPTHRRRLMFLVKGGSAESEPYIDEVLALCELVSIIEAGGKSYTGGVTPLAREVAKLFPAAEADR